MALKKVMAIVLGIVCGASAFLVGCTMKQHQESQPAASGLKNEPAGTSQGSQPSSLREVLAGMSIRDLSPDAGGQRMIVQDATMSLFEVSAGGSKFIGKTPEIGGVVADWRSDGEAYAFARETAKVGTYEIVEVTKTEQRVRATVSGYPNAVHYAGEKLYFIDADGLKEVSGDGKVSVAPLALGLSNQRAVCFWGASLPTCVSGYGNNGNNNPRPDVTLVKPAAEPMKLTGKGIHPILVDAAFSPDGRMVAAVLWPRFSTSDIGRVVVATLDQGGRPTAVKDYPIRSSHVAFDRRGQLLVFVIPSEPNWGSVGILDLNTGEVRPVTKEQSTGTFVMSPAGDRIYVLPGRSGKTVEVVPLP